MRHAPMMMLAEPSGELLAATGTISYSYTPGGSVEGMPWPAVTTVTFAAGNSAPGGDGDWGRYVTTKELAFTYAGVGRGTVWETKGPGGRALARIRFDGTEWIPVENGQDAPELENFAKAHANQIVTCYAEVAQGGG